MPSVDNPTVIRHLLETDRRWAVYALGDLAPQLFRQCDWFCAAEGAPAVVLLCHAFAPPVLFALGEAPLVGSLMEEIGARPALYLHVRPEIVPVIRARYEVTQEKSMWRMVLDPKVFRPTQSGQIARLGLSDLPALRRLYADGEAVGEAPAFFNPGMLEDGVYFGSWEGDQLTAVAGTHLVVPAEGVAAIGNVYTRRDRRGRGLASALTSAVAAELVRLGLRTVALNVEQRNAAAIHVYERLGFVRYGAFNEGLALLPPAADALGSESR
jgi:ribosomal protein S18 acetylase RimI-like enzyme